MPSTDINITITGAEVVERVVEHFAELIQALADDGHRARNPVGCEICAWLTRLDVSWPGGQTHVQTDAACSAAADCEVHPHRVAGTPLLGLIEQYVSACTEVRFRERSGSALAVAEVGTRARALLSEIHRRVGAFTSLLDAVDRSSSEPLLIEDLRKARKDLGL